MAEMTVADYTPFIERMIQRYEGGYGWDRRDPGGPTKYGITCYDLAEFMHDKMDSMARWAPLVQAMPLVTADEIIENKYAVPCHFNDLSPGKDCVVLDFGYNSGPSRSIKTAQKLCGVAVDGILGAITLAAINAYEPPKFIQDMAHERIIFLQGLSIWPTFKRGWIARIADLTDYSLALLDPPRLTVRKHEKKLMRIPLAFAKGWE